MEIIIEKIFIGVLNMSITSTFVIVAILLVRLFLARAPKAFSYWLWMVVLFRLLCPVSFESSIGWMSLFDTGVSPMEYVPVDIGLMAQPHINTGIPPLTNALDDSLPAATPAASANPMQVIVLVLATVWAAGAAGLLLFGVLACLRLKRRLTTACLSDENIYRLEGFPSAFVFGFFRPKIYLPIPLDEIHRAYIICHEQMHIRRFDHISKLIGYLAVCIHWFNPLVWLSFELMSRDMEMSCDEAVVRQMGEQIKMDYSMSLVSLSVPGRLVPGGPLAFGETNTKARIKNILQYRPPAFGAAAAAAVAVLLLSLFFAANPKKAEPPNTLASRYLGYRTAYVGDNSKVGGIIALLRYPEGVHSTSFFLETDRKPYGISVDLQAADSSMEMIGNPANQQQFETNAAILFALIDNVSVVRFSLSEDDENLPLLLIYTRDEVNSRFGRDVRLFAESESDFEKLLSVQTGETPAQVESAYEISKLGRNGKLLWTRTLLSEEEQKLAEDIVFNFVVKSAAWEGVDPNTLDEVYLIRSEHDSEYYAFLLDGYACLQPGKDGWYSRIDNALYQKLTALAEGNAHE